MMIVRSSARGDICTIECCFRTSPPAPHSLPTTHPQTRSDGRGGAGYGIGGRLRIPALSHHSGAAPALRSFRLLPLSVAPLAPLSSPQPTGASLRVSLIAN